MKSRRELLQATALTAASAPLLRAQDHAPHGGLVQVETKPSHQARFFKKKELALLTRLTDLIIPPSDTPGAAAAGVPYYIDFQAHTNPVLGAQLRKDLASIDKQSKAGFLKENEPAQIALLTAMSASRGTDPFRAFKQLKDLTIDGYYGSREGLTQELGWNANTFLREFKGCTHPEHEV